LIYFPSEENHGLMELTQPSQPLLSILNLSKYQGQRLSSGQGIYFNSLWLCPSHQFPANEVFLKEAMRRSPARKTQLLKYHQSLILYGTFLFYPALPL